MGVVFAILGGILKWILLIILGLIGLILVLLLIVMLTPLRYKIKWIKQADTMGGEARISWLLHLISFRLTQSGKEIKWTIKIGPKIVAASYPLPNKEGKPKKQKKKKKIKQKENPKTSPTKKPEVKPPVAEKTDPIPLEETSPVWMPEPQAEPIAADEGLRQEEIREEFPAAPEEAFEERETPALEESPVTKKSWRRKVTEVCWKIRRFFEKILGTIRGIRDKIRAIPRKIRGLLDKWDQVKAIWEGYPQKSETVEAVKRLVGGLLKAPLPKRYQVELRVGMKDPATTGQILMYYYALTPILFPKTTRRRRFVLEAEFEEPVLEVTAMCKGRFSLGSFIWPVIRALLNAHIRRLIRYVLSIKKNSSQKEI